MTDKRAQFREAAIGVVMMIHRTRNLMAAMEAERNLAAEMRDRPRAIRHGLVAQALEKHMRELAALQELVAKLAEVAPIPQGQPQHSYALAEFQASVQNVFSQRGARC